MISGVISINTVQWNFCFLAYTSELTYVLLSIYPASRFWKCPISFLEGYLSSYIHSLINLFDLQRHYSSIFDCREQILAGQKNYFEWTLTYRHLFKLNHYFCSFHPRLSVNFTIWRLHRASATRDINFQFVSKSKTWIH